MSSTVTGAFATTAKGLLRNALRVGNLQKLLQFCLMLGKRQEPAFYGTVQGCRRQEAPTMVLDIFVTIPCPVLPSASYGPPTL